MTKKGTKTPKWQQRDAKHAKRHKNNTLNGHKMSTETWNKTQNYKKTETKQDQGDTNDRKVI